MTEKNKEWSKTVEEVIETLNTNTKGLTTKEAEKRLLLHGKNKIPQGKKKTIIGIFIEQFKSPIIFILIIAAIFAIATGSKADSIFIIIVISINAIIRNIPRMVTRKKCRKVARNDKNKSKGNKRWRSKRNRFRKHSSRRYSRVRVWKQSASRFKTNICKKPKYR